MKKNISSSGKTHTVTLSGYVGGTGYTCYLVFPDTTCISSPSSSSSSLNVSKDVYSGSTIYFYMCPDYLSSYNLHVYVNSKLIYRLGRISDYVYNPMFAFNVGSDISITFSDTNVININTIM